MNPTQRLFALLAFLAVAASLAMAQNNSRQDARHTAPLARSYSENESLVYHMKAINKGRSDTIRYEADAKGIVRKNSTGFVEEYAWANLSFNGQAAPLPTLSSDFRQQLSLDPNVPPVMPDFRHVNPMLIGPAADMMTFYADEWLAIKQGTLQGMGDHAYVKHGTPSSWADGVHTIIGQDSIDFDITLKEINSQDQTAKVMVRHVPPPKPQISTPAKWMDAAVSDTPNNWVEVSKTNDGKYLGEIGKEIFDVELTVSMKDGRILFADIDNPVTVLARECTDAELAQCSAPEHYEIRRHIEINLVP